jgi:hypothetical protein
VCILRQMGSPTKQVGLLLAGGCEDRRPHRRSDDFQAVRRESGLHALFAEGWLSSGGNAPFGAIFARKGYGRPRSLAEHPVGKSEVSALLALMLQAIPDYEYQYVYINGQPVLVDRGRVRSST